MRRSVACVGSLDIAKPGRCENDRAFVAPWTTDGAANAAGVTPHGASYHTDGCLSSKRARAQRRRRAGSRLGALRPLRLPARPARRARARHATPTLRTPSRLPVHHLRRLLCVSGGCGRQSTPLVCRARPIDGTDGVCPVEAGGTMGEAPVPPQRFPAAADTRPLALFPRREERGDGTKRGPSLRRGIRAARGPAGSTQANKVRFRGVCPKGAHSGKSAAGLASLGAYAKQCAPGGAVDGASWVIPSAAPPF